jgi:hypothetical protein
MNAGPLQREGLLLWRPGRCRIAAVGAGRTNSTGNTRELVRQLE